MAIAIQNGEVILPDRTVRGGTVIVEGKRIAHAGEARKTLRGAEEIDARGGYVSPGLIELHFHGAGPRSLDPPSAEGLRAMADYLLRRGITRFMPTMMASEPLMRDMAALIAEKGLEDRALGIYPEGPFISTEKKGGVLTDYIRSVNLDYLEHLQETCGGAIRMMTFAPELEGAEKLPAAMRRLGILPCIGHTAATCARAIEVAPRGKFNCTHLFNAMTGLSHHEPGVAAFGINYDHVWTELNPDGTHVAPEVLKLVWRAKRHDRIVLISDAVISAGAPEGEYAYMGKTVVADARGVYRKEDATLVGSRLLLNQGTMRFRRTTGASLHEAVALASLNPARMLGLGAKLGSLEAGKTADVVVFDRRLKKARVGLVAGRRLL